MCADKSEQYEYTGITITLLATDNVSLGLRLNALGEAGWKLVLPIVENGTTTMLVFMRQKKPSA
ncbi:MAG: hypothetical protein WC471_03230 [Candidatus Woesearchaeota archaeon]